MVQPPVPVPSRRPRKRRVLALLLAAPLLGAAAAEPPSLPRLVDNERGTHVSLSIPGFVIRLAGRLAPIDDAPATEAIRHVRGLRLEVREGAYYPEDGLAEIRRVSALRARQGYEPLLTVRGPEEDVAVLARIDRRDRIRSVAVLVADGESWADIRLRTRIGAEDLGALLQAAGVGPERLGLDGAALDVADGESADEGVGTAAGEAPSAEG